MVILDDGINFSVYKHSLMNTALYSILILNLGVNDKYIDFKHLYNV